jgi:hypothetical protein
MGFLAAIISRTRPRNSRRRRKWRVQRRDQGRRRVGTGPHWQRGRRSNRLRDVGVSMLDQHARSPINRSGRKLPAISRHRAPFNHATRLELFLPGQVDPRPTRRRFRKGVVEGGQRRSAAGSRTTPTGASVLKRVTKSSRPSTGRPEPSLVSISCSSGPVH